MVHLPGFGVWLLICIMPMLGIVGVIVFIIILNSSRSQNDQRGFSPITGPGKYIVRGVDRQTRADRTERIQADSEANARVKAELDGIIVTSVVFERP